MRGVLAPRILNLGTTCMVRDQLDAQTALLARNDPMVSIALDDGWASESDWMLWRLYLMTWLLEFGNISVLGLNLLVYRRK